VRERLRRGGSTLEIQPNSQGKRLLLLHLLLCSTQRRGSATANSRWHSAL
jgi:hypothetical protein